MLVLVVGAFLVLSAFLKAEVRGLGSTDPGLLSVGVEVPSVRSSSLEGNSLALDRYLQQHRLVAITFWATWCQPCKPELDRLAKLYSSHRSELGVVAINLDDDTSAVRASVETLALPFPVLLDPEMRVADRFGVRAIPTTFLVSPSGEIQAVFRGFQTGLDVAVNYHLSSDGS